MSSINSTKQGVRVEVQGLRKSFDGQEVLNVDFDVEAGEVFVIMGPSGSGKSVLLRQIMGLEETDGGTILIEGESVHGSDIMSRYRLALVFQSGALLNSLTVGENLGLYWLEQGSKSRAEVDLLVREKLELVGLMDVINKYPSQLSGGMKKRVAIARSLVVDPQLILYDEPTSELDPLNAVMIAQEIRGLNKRTGVTSIVVTHDRDLAFGVGHRIAIIEKGHIILIGTPREIRASSDPRVQNFINADFTTDTQFYAKHP